MLITILYAAAAIIGVVVIVFTAYIAWAVWQVCKAMDWTRPYE